MDKFDPKTLTEEKSLAWIAWQSRSLPWNVFNTVVTTGVFVLVVFYVAFSQRAASVFADEVRSIATVGLSFGAQVLGFLIAGFTIFATLTKPSLFKRMAVIRHTASGLSYLKYNFFSFVQVFIHYLCYTSLCMLVYIAGSKGGIVSEILNGMFPASSTARQLVVRSAFCLLIVWTVYILVVLKSFIFNTYHVIMTAIRWDFEGVDADNPPPKT